MNDTNLSQGRTFAHDPRRVDLAPFALGATVNATLAGSGVTGFRSARAGSMSSSRDETTPSATFQEPGRPPTA